LHIKDICRVSTVHGIAALTWAFSVRQCGHSTGEFQQDLTLNSSPPEMFNLCKCTQIVQMLLHLDPRTNQGQGQAKTRNTEKDYDKAKANYNKRKKSDKDRDKIRKRIRIAIRQWIRKQGQ
jgi:hypothetical protein